MSRGSIARASRITKIKWPSSGSGAGHKSGKRTWRMIFGICMNLSDLYKQCGAEMSADLQDLIKELESKGLGE